MSKSNLKCLAWCLSNPEEALVDQTLQLCGWGFGFGDFGVGFRVKEFWGLGDFRSWGLGVWGFWDLGLGPVVSELAATLNPKP